MDCESASCWHALVDARPWSKDAAEWMGHAIDAAGGDRVEVRRLQRELASEYAMGTAWSVSNEPNVAAAAQVRIEQEQTRWEPTEPLTTLADIGVVPYDEPYEVLRARIDDDDDDDLRTYLSIGQYWEHGNNYYKQLLAFSRAASYTTDPVVRTYAILHGFWQSCELQSKLSYDWDSFIEARPPARVLKDANALRLDAYAAAGEISDALKVIDDPAELRQLAAETLIQGRPPDDIVRVRERELELQPENNRAPMWRFDIVRLSGVSKDARGRDFERLSGPGSAWWRAADGEARRHVARLIRQLE